MSENNKWWTRFSTKSAAKTRPIAEYKVLYGLGPSSRIINGLVNEHLSIGWELQGGVSVSIRTSTRKGDGDTVSEVLYCQAMIKKTDA